MKNDYIRIRLEPYLKELLKELAQEKGFTLSDYIRYTMRQQIPVAKIVKAQMEVKAS